MIVASRYAKSFIDLSVENKQLEESRNDMKLIKLVCDENHDFSILLNSPVIKTDKKIAVFNAVFSGKISNLSLSFLILLAKKRRESYVSEIALAFDEQFKAHNNITTAVITTATGLDEKLKSSVLEIVKQTNTNNPVELVERVDSSIIGGFILSISDKKLDQSVKRKLNDLKKNFASSENLIIIN